MHPTAMAFAVSALAGECRGKTVVEAGAFDVNGSVRPHVEMTLGPASYTSTDMRIGPGVNVACLAEELPALFDAADVVISTEMLEHAADWKAAMSGMIEILAPGGVLVLTTRSEGFPVHGYPDDHWRYSVDAMRVILAAAGLDVERCEPDPDPQSPGVFAKARKPAGWTWPDVSAAWDSAGVTAVTG
jgi:hypothetical protein